jgi:hypothetical protein
MSEAKKIHERLGAVVGAVQATVAGPATTSVSYVMWFDSRKAWGAFGDSLPNDADWQKFARDVLGATEPSARLISSVTASDVPGFEQPVARPAPGEVLNRAQWQITRGRFGDVARDLAEWQKMAAAAGVPVRFLLNPDAGPETGLLTTVFRCPNFEAYGALGDTLFADPQFQAFWSHILDSGAATLLNQSVGQFLAI